MELKDFIRETILQIFEGVKDAQCESIKLNASVNPFNKKHSDGFNTYYSFDELHNIEFEVILSELSNNESKAGIGVFLGNLGIGLNDKSEKANTSNTKIKFSIPVSYPMYKLKQNE